jgi:secernin
MCDTLVATPDVTADGVMIFGKNSDREPNEAQHLFYAPAADHAPGGQLRCTYIEIPQVEHTYAVLLSKPFWMWGAEMGSNEHGVTIGNEAVFSKVQASTKPALLGMDLLRLGLERGCTARAALDVITALLETYGQGGKSGYTRQLFYHNSYIIADAKEAWVLETIDRHWAAEQIHGVYTISNGLTLGNHWDLVSDELVSYAVERGWCKGREDFDFAGNYSDFVYTRYSASRARCSRTTGLLQVNKGAITVQTVMAALRDHGVSEDSSWSPDQGVSDPKVCYHASFGPIRMDQSVASQVSSLSPERATHFFTGTSAPCTSIFKPVWIDAPLPDMGPAPQGVYNPETLFWRHEQLHRATLRDYTNRIKLYQGELNDLEDRFVAEALERAGRPVEERGEFVKQCFAEAGSAEAGWLERVSKAPVVKKPGRLYMRFWQGINRKAQMPD